MMNVRVWIYSVVAFAVMLIPAFSHAQSHSRPASIGPFEIVSADSTSRLRLQFVGQQLITWQETRNDSGETQSDLTTELRRVRLGLRGSFDNDKTSFYLHLSFAPRSVELMDFWLNRRVSENEQVRIGQYKIPFTRFRIQSLQRLTFADWPIVSKYFGAERQIGVTLHNGYENPPSWGYAAGLFTGVNARAAHGIGIATVYGIELANASDLIDPGPKSDIHPEAFVHLSYRTRDMRVSSETDAERGPVRFFAGLSAAWDFDPTEHTDFTQRFAAEVLSKWNGWSACAIGYAGFAEIGTTSKNELAMLGALTQAAYRINETWEVSARFAIVDLSDSLIVDVNRLLDQEGVTVRQQEATFGINYYISGHSLKWQNDAGLIRSTYRCGHQTQYRIRSQLQFAF